MNKKTSLRGILFGLSITAAIWLMPITSVSAALTTTLSFTPSVDGCMGAQNPDGNGAGNLVSFFIPWWDHSSIYIRFDLSGVDPAQYSGVKSAQLALNISALNQPGGIALNVGRVAPGNLNTDTTIMSYSYNNRIANPQIKWTSNGAYYGGFQSTCTAGTGTYPWFDSLVPTSTGLITLDVTDAVRQWLYYGALNNGFIIKMGNDIFGLPGGTRYKVDITSMEDSNPAMRPRLNIELFNLNKPYRMWYQPSFADTNPEYYSYANYVNTNWGWAYGALWNDLGVATGHWAYGPNSPYSGGDPNYYTAQANPDFAGWTSIGPGVDEWTTIPTDAEKLVCAQGYRAARTQWPLMFATCYATSPDVIFKGLVSDGTFDLAAIEGYTYVPEGGSIDIEGIKARCESMKTSGLLDNTIVVFGHIIAPFSEFSLYQAVSNVHDAYPEMPGIGMYGREDDTTASRQLIQYANSLTGLYYGDEVIFLDGFESGSFAAGGWTVTGSSAVREGFTWATNDTGVNWTGTNGFQSSGTGTTVSSTITTTGSKTLTVTSIVNSWVFGGKLNNGFVIQIGGPYYGLPGGTSNNIDIASSEYTTNTSKRPKLRVKMTSREAYQNIQGPTFTVDGNLQYRSIYSKDFSGTKLNSFFYSWWDYGAIYLWFNLSGLDKIGHTSVYDAKLVFEVTSVTNPSPTQALRVTRISESNTNTEATIVGSDGAKAAALRNAQAIERAVSTAGRSNISVNYRLKTQSFSAGDHFYAEWYNGSSWQLLEDVTSNISFTSRQFSLPSAAANNSGFKIRFRQVGGTACRSHVDFVRLTGDKL